MAANTNPIYTLVPQLEWATVAATAANTAKDGTGTIGTNIHTVFTAGATDGSYVQKLRFRAAGTNVATVARVFINNGSTNATAANNILFDEFTLSATTLSETAATQLYELPVDVALPPGYKINVAVATAVAAGYYISAVGGRYS